MKLADPSRCTGCGACYEACPKKAIQLSVDAEGFMVPSIDSNICIECGICNQVCPVIGFPEANEPREVYAAQNKDKQILMNSTSGGVFTALAKEIFRRGGVVYGCVWDKDYNAIIVRADTIEETIPMRGSKYTWSWAGDTFPEVKRQLEDKIIVLFAGLPCQVAGLKKYLRKGYENLYLLSFFCGGTPSPLALKEYVKSISTADTIDNLQLKFRDKQKYGVGVHVTYVDKKGKAVHQSLAENSFYYAFFTKVFNRRSCYTCLFRYRQRVEDITIGDYWGVANYHQELDAKAGVSALLINTEKGQELIDSVREEIWLSETKIENIARANNLTLSDNKKVYAFAEFRDDYFKILRERGWKAAERRYLVFDKKRIRMWIREKIPYKYIRLIKKAVGR